MVHSLTLLVITLGAGKWAALIPMPVRAAILVVVAYHMSEWRAFRAELKSPKSDVVVLLTTFVLTVLVDLTVAIEVGMVLAAFLFIRRMAEVTSVTEISRELDDDEELPEDAVYARDLPPGVIVYEINGPFFFGAAETFKDTVARVSRKPKVLIIRLRHVPSLDGTAMHVLKDVVHRTRRDGSAVLLCELNEQPRKALDASELLAELGAENVLDSIDEAVDRARILVAGRPSQTGAAIPAAAP
jgi:SulP family sulfate permease